MACKQKVFDPDKRLHWPIVESYLDGKLSYKQAAAQLWDLGCSDWEIDLYLDDDQTGPE